MFALRAADEHRKLDVSQFTIGTDINGKFLRFTGKDLQELARWLTPSKIDSKRPENICQSRAKGEVCCKHI